MIITTIGDIAFENHMKLEEGYQYDIPFDNLMLPYIPIADILRKDGLITEDVKVGFAHPVGYRGLCLMSEKLLKNHSGVAPFIKLQFTNDRTEKKNGMRIRSIKAGKRFFAAVMIPPNLQEDFEKKITGRKRIGITAEGITGEVEMGLFNEVPDFRKEETRSSLAHYVSLDYSVTLLTPTCFQAPYEEGEKTYLYIPGAVAAAFVRSCLQDKNVADMGSLIRAIAEYIKDNPYAFLGELTQEGYGEVLLSVTGLNEAEIPAELPARVFDVCCVTGNEGSTPAGYIRRDTENVVPGSAGGRMR